MDRPYIPGPAAGAYHRLPPESRSQIARLVDREFAGRNPGAPGVLDPSNPGHRPYVRAWLRIRDEVMGNYGFTHNVGGTSRPSTTTPLSGIRPMHSQSGSRSHIRPLRNGSRNRGAIDAQLALDRARASSAADDAKRRALFESALTSARTFHEGFRARSQHFAQQARDSAHRRFVQSIANFQATSDSFRARLHERNSTETFIAEPDTPKLRLWLPHGHEVESTTAPEYDEAADQHRFEDADLGDLPPESIYAPADHGESDRPERTTQERSEDEPRGVFFILGRFVRRLARGFQGLLAGTAEAQEPPVYQPASTAAGEKELRDSLDRFFTDLLIVDLRILETLPADTAATIRRALDLLQKFKKSGRFVLRTGVHLEGYASFHPLSGSSRRARNPNDPGEIYWHPPIEEEIGDGQRKADTNPLLHEAVHAVHHADHPRLSREFSRAWDSGFFDTKNWPPARKSRPRAIRLLKWKTWTEYDAYRITAAFEGAMDPKRLAGRTPHEIALAKVGHTLAVLRTLGEASLRALEDHEHTPEELADLVSSWKPKTRRARKKAATK